MTGEPDSLRLDDRPPEASPARPLDLRGLVGGWLNTDGGDSGGVLRFDLAERDGRLFAAATAVGDYEWQQVEAVAFAPTVADGHAWAFNCRFEFEGGVATDVSAYNKQGILVAAIFTAFDDGSSRADYWTREFFHREGRL
jgi:hypothetical protein